MQNTYLDKELHFFAWYTKMGQLQTVGNKSGYQKKIGKVIKEDETKIEYRLNGENGLRKLNKNCLEKFQDFGTSIIGIYSNELTEDAVLELILDCLNKRISETYTTSYEIAEKISTNKTSKPLKQFKIGVPEELELADDKENS